MKNLFLKILLVVLLFSSCNSDDDVFADKQDVCVYAILNKPQNQLVSNSEQEQADSLFVRNDISLENLQVYQVNENADSDLPINIRCYQYANGVRIFFSVAIFSFDNSGDLTFQSGNRIENIDLDATPHLTQKYLTAKFIEQIKHDEFKKNQLDEIVEDCLDFQFGYFDLNAGTENTDTHFIKTWKITPHNQDYPRLLINDDTGWVVFYDNGVRT